MELTKENSVRNRFQEWKWLQELSCSKLTHKIKGKKQLYQLIKLTPPTVVGGEEKARKVKLKQKILEAQLYAREQEGGLKKFTTN